MNADYSRFTCQGGVRSLYYLSKLAQSSSIQVLVPPTVLIGFKDQTRFMFNANKTGRIKVQTGYFTAEEIQEFIENHMCSFSKMNLQQSKCALAETMK